MPNQTICRVDRWGNRECDHIHAEDLTANGGGYHRQHLDEEFPPGWTVQNAHHIFCEFCDERIAPEDMHSHVYSHWVDAQRTPERS